MDAAMSAIEDVAKRARAAARKIQALPRAEKDAALAAVHTALCRARTEIATANDADKAAARARMNEGEMSPATFKRLDLAGPKFDAMLAGVESVRALDDPVGKCTLARVIDDGLELFRVACPIGVFAIIFEARPEAGVQIASLAIKSGNAVILKGGREAERSNAALAGVIRGALKAASFPQDAVQLVETREEVRELLDQSQYIDLIIPRGSKALVSYITNNTRIPVMGHADGICAVYIDASADVSKASRIAVDSKAQYPAVCNAAETLLVHAAAVDTVLPAVGAALGAAGVELRADTRSRAALAKIGGVKVVAATDEDYDTEFLELKMVVKVVDSVSAAAEHINRHGSGHTDCIVTEDAESAREFLAMVDSAGVYHNASTRFADGFRLGFGAEVGVSTHRTHARGPVGLEGLMIYKYKLLGNGHVVQPYVDGEKSFRHEDMPGKLPAL